MLRGSKISENSWEQSCQLRYTKTRGYTRAIPYTRCNSNFDGRHSNFFWAIIHLFLHPSLKQISPRITKGSTTTHTEKNPWVTHHYALVLVTPSLFGTV